MRQVKPIGYIRTDFSTKFGIPRQSGLVKELEGRIIFEPEFRIMEAVRGLEEFSHIWLIWEFSQSAGQGWSPTVRPPRLGGNKRMGVFATRSPFRPNPIGLSCVELKAIEADPHLGPVLHVLGVDLMDHTPILDIKPYIPHADSCPEAEGGFSAAFRDYGLEVVFPEKWLGLIPAEKQAALIGALRQDPRPSYQNDPDRIYGFEFAGFEVRFRVADLRLIVCEVAPV
nr:tRNA (N6-threonylcarbamoyladenosine(37)-N6)-methyltransferase TrmO [Hominibacterium faecale]